MQRPVFTTVICIALTLTGVAKANQPPVESWSISELIAGLADPDSTIRAKAADRLIDIGMPARPDLIKASRGADPEQRAQAARVLRKLPWSVESDAHDVRMMLDRYGDSNDTSRAGIIRRLYDLKASDTLLRLLKEEPSDTIRWLIVLYLFDNREPDVLTSMRELKPSDDDAAGLFLLGRALIERDRPRAIGLFKRAIDADALSPGNDGTLLDYAFDQIVLSALESENFAEAVAFLRRQVPRDLVPKRSRSRLRRPPVASLAKLLALHEYFGPLDRFAWDYQTWSIQFDDKPSLIKSISTRLAWLGAAPPLPLGLTSELSVKDRYDAGSFLAAGELMTAADLELDAAAQLLGSRADVPRGAIRDRDAREGAYDEMYSELHWRRARAAHDAGDVEAANGEVVRLMEFSPGSNDAAIRIINWLKESGRKKEGKEIFDRAYQASRERLEMSAIKAGARNDLAWLCARSGERLDEAVTLAQQAVDEMPDVAAFLDTLAEAKYRTGETDEAIALEGRALELAPGTRFMKQQLARFRAGQP